MAERSGRGRDAQRHAALLRRVGAAQHAGNDAEREPRKPGTDQYAAGKDERKWRRRVCHGEQACDVEHGACQHDLRGAEAVGEHARDRLHQAPHQVLHRHREREGFAAPVEVGAHRLQEEAEAVPHTHGQREHEPAADENHGGGAPVGARGKRGHGILLDGARQRSRPPGSGCSASSSCSVATSASIFPAPSRAVTCACARFQ